MPAFVQPVIVIPQGQHAPPRGAIVQSLGAMQNLLEQQTGHHLRVAGHIVVIRVPWRGRLTPTVIDRLAAAVPVAPDTISAVFYASPWLDAFGDWPPGRPGHIAAVGTGAAPAVLGRVMLHEVFHAMGLVPGDAPHSDGGGHVTDSRRDLMSGNILSIPRPVIDVGHDDYWDELLSSPYLV